MKPHFFLEPKLRRPPPPALEEVSEDKVAQALSNPHTRHVLDVLREVGESSPKALSTLLRSRGLHGSPRGTAEKLGMLRRAGMATVRREDLGCTDPLEYNLYTAKEATDGSPGD